METTAQATEEFGAALRAADAAALAQLLAADAALARTELDGVAPLLTLLRGPGRGDDVRACVKLLLDEGANPNAHTVEWGGEGIASVLFAAVDHGDPTLLRLLVDAGARPDDDAFYHACEQSDTEILDLLYRKGFENLVNHKLDFEDAAGLRWFLERGVGVNANHCLHHAISRGRGLDILTLLLDAGAEIDTPWDRWDVGRRPLALAARCGHLAAYELLESRGATAELDDVDRAVLAVARGESTELPAAPPPSLGNPCGTGYGWILGQFALLGRTEIVANLLDSGLAVDTRGWSNFTPLDQAAMHGRTETVRLLVDRGADLTDRAWDDGPTPLDCALWGYRNNRAADGDYRGTVDLLVAAKAPTRYPDQIATVD